MVDCLLLSIVYHGDVRAVRSRINKVSWGFPWVYPGGVMVVGCSGNCPGLCVAWATLDASGRSCLVNPLLAELGFWWPYISRTLGCLGVVFFWGSRVVCDGGLSWRHMFG